MIAGKLYAGSESNGKIFVYDGSTWSESYDSSESYIFSLAAIQDTIEGMVNISITGSAPSITTTSAAPSITFSGEAP